MRTISTRVTSLGAGLAMALVVPTSVSAHGGHPWLDGAAQPLLSPDHFLAGLFVAVLVGLGVASLARHSDRSSASVERVGD